MRLAKNKLFWSLLVVVISGVSLNGVLAVGDSASAILEVTNSSGGGDGGSSSGGGGGEDPPPPAPIPGCTDPAALNYNSAATASDSSCLYQSVPNVAGFSAVFEAAGNQIRLTWVNPSLIGLSTIRIVRDTSIVTNPLAGTLIYEGTGQSTIDSATTPGTTYFYTAFVRNNLGQYSSGAFASVSVPLPAETPPVPPPGVPPDTGLGDDGPGSVDPFSALPTTVSQDPLIKRFDAFDVLFIQAGEIAKRFTSQGTITVKSDKPFTVLIPYNLLPEVLKTIGLTIKDVANNRTFSYLLQADPGKTAYTATLPPIFGAGSYPLYIYLINYRDQTVKKLEGTLVVAAGRPSPLTVIEKQVAPAIITTGLAAGLVQTVNLVSGGASLADLPLLFMRGIGALLGFFGLRRKHQPWGTVYDAVTKRPIDPAYVSLKEAGELSGANSSSSASPGKEVATAITDIDGRYGFFVNPGRYLISAGKTHYQFPSAALTGRQEDELYSNLYFGDPITVSEGEVIDKNIPLDPIGFDWNEFVKSKQNFFKVQSRREIIRTRFYGAVYAAGLLMSLGVMAVSPNWLNFGALIIYALIALLRSLWHRTHRVATVTGKSGEPLSFAVIRAWLPDGSQELKRVVADILGRFYLLIRPGTYKITVDEKLPDGSYHRVAEMLQEMPKGVLKTNVIVAAG